MEEAKWWIGKSSEKSESFSSPIVEDISSTRPHLHNTNERYADIDSRSIPTAGAGHRGCQRKYGPVYPGASVYRVTRIYRENCDVGASWLASNLVNDINARLTRGSNNGKFSLIFFLLLFFFFLSFWNSSSWNFSKRFERATCWIVSLFSSRSLAKTLIFR